MATDVMRMAQQARELCGTGPAGDLPRAIRILRKAREVLGELAEPGDDDADGR